MYSSNTNLKNNNGQIPIIIEWNVATTRKKKEIQPMVFLNIKPDQNFSWISIPNNVYSISPSNQLYSLLNTNN